MILCEGGKILEKGGKNVGEGKILGEKGECTPKISLAWVVMHILQEPNYKIKHFVQV